MKTLPQNLTRQNGKLLTNNLPDNACQEKLPLFITPVSGKSVQLDFNGGSVTSNAGVLLLSETERQVGIIEAVAACIPDNRRPGFVDHTLKEMVSQRVFQIACGDEDAVDSNHLRTDPALKLAVGRLPDEGADLASQPTLSRLENGVSRTTLMRMGYALVDGFIDSYPQEPEVIVLDFDDTDNTVYGSQQECLFNTYYGDYCYLPLHVYEGLSGKLITTILRPGKRPSGKETRAYLKRLVGHIRQSFKETIIVFRGDSHYSSPEVFEWIQGQERVYSVVGLTSNAVLRQMAEPVVREVLQQYALHKQPLKRYHSFLYRAKSWAQERRVVVKVEQNEQGLNIRFISTDLLQATATSLYTTIYCARGNMELYIKDHKTYLKSNRSSCHRFEANQFRLFLHSLAYVLLHTLKTQVLKATGFATATMETLRLKLLKVGARVVELKTRIKLHLPTAYPYQSVFRTCLAVFAQLPVRPAGADRRKMKKALAPQLC